MRGRFICSRTLTLGLLLAAAGFCYALSGSREASPGAEERGVGSTVPLRFTNPQIFFGPGVNTGEYDLGDAQGTLPITRYISACGGLRPYRFTSQGTMSLSVAVGATDSTLTLGLSGIISGRMAGTVPIVGPQGQNISPYRTAAITANATTGAGSTTLTTNTSGIQVGMPVSGVGIQPGTTVAAVGASSVTLSQAATLSNNGQYFIGGGDPGLRFLVSLVDAKGTAGDTINAFFNIYLVTGKAFRFAMDTIPGGQAGNPVDAASAYMSKIETVGGLAPITFTVLSVSGAASSQEQLGIFVAADGTVYGKPLVTGTATIVVQAKDATGAIALSRPVNSNRNVAPPAAPNQTFTLNIIDNPINTSDLVTTSAKVTLDSSRTNKDSLTYMGILNAVGQDNFSLTNSTVSFRLGGISVTGVLDRRGSFRAKLPDFSRVNMRVSPRTGLFSVNISNGSFSSVMNTTAFKPGANTTEAVGAVVGDAVVATEVLAMATKQDGTKTTLSYRIGRSGSNLGGAFQLVKVRGRDAGSAVGAAGTSWNADFIAMPRLGATAAGQGVDNVSRAQVNIGSKFTQTLPNGSSRPTLFSFRGDRASLVRSARLDAKTFKGNVMTNGLATTQTGLPPASQSPRVGNIFFDLGLSLTRTGAAFSGEHARRVFGLKNVYSDTPR
jgi:hypothetical protein